MPTDHAPLGPSKAEALEICPCYEREPFEERDDQGETPSERGTRLHLAVETRNLDLCHHEDERNLVQQCLNFMSMLEGSAGEGHEVHREVRVEIPNPDDPEDLLTWGTSDWVLFMPGRKKCVGADWKFIRTMSVSSPQKNLQFRCYAVGLLCKYPELEEVQFTMVAPEFGLVAEPAIFTRADIAPTQERIKAVKAAWLDPFKKPCPSDLCSTCKHAARCPALGKLAVVSARGVNLPIPETFRPEAMRTPSERSLALVIAGALAQWAEQIKALNNEFGRQNREVKLPGFKWMSRAGNPNVGDVKAARGLLLLSEPDFLECCRVSLTELGKKYAAVYQISEKEGRAKVDEALQSVIRRGAQVEYWMRDKNGETVEEIVAGVKQQAFPATTAPAVTGGYEQSEARASLPG